MVWQVAACHTNKTTINQFKKIKGMKKSLLFAALIAGAMSANAQVENVAINGEAAGLNESDVTPITAGTVFGSSDNVTVKAAFDDSYKIVSCTHKGFKNVIVNGETFTYGNGVQGSSNPGGQSLAKDASTPPTTGAVIQLDVKKDGYVAVVSKLSSNKEYYVWEGNAISASPVAYTLYMDWSDAAQAGQPTIEYALPADEMGYINFDAADIDKYLNGTKLRWPEKIVLGADAADVKKNGFGVIVFQVFADAETYMVQAAGSKISVPGVIFSEKEITDLQITGEDESGNPLAIAFIGEGGTGISDITATENVNAPAYNIAGQRVNANAKGLIIKNGKKYLNK